jgi:tryptophan synthase alpha chain
LIIPDLPYEQESILKAYLQERDICLIRLVSLTTVRIDKDSWQDAQGFVYAVAINGVTGKSNQYTDELDYHLYELTELSPVPLYRFWCSSQEDILRFNRVSDGVIVGSKIVAGLFNGQQNDVQKLVTFGCGVDKTHSNYKFY